MHVSCIYTNEFLVSAVNSDDKQFVFKEIFPMGILYISSSLKKAGYDTEINFYVDEINLEYVIEKIKSNNSKVIAVSSVCENDYIFVKEAIHKIKNLFPGIKVIIGGQYPTLAAEEIITNIDIDAVCIGEGEVAVVEYIKQVENNSYKKTDNLWIRNNTDEILKCDKVEVIDDIDLLPYPDRVGWLKANNISLQDTLAQKIVVERGCNNRCIYCSHHALSKKQNGKYLRFRKVKEVINEMEFMCKQFPNTNYINLSMDNALSNISYFEDLLNSLINFNKIKEQNIKFELTFNVTSYITNNIDKFVDLLKMANVVKITCSLESGSLEIRKKLNRPYYENEDIINLCAKLRSNNIITNLLLMYCYPFETEESWNKTIECVNKCNPDMFSLMWLTPFKGTKLYDMVKLTKYEDAPLEDKKRFDTFFDKIVNKI